MLMILCYETDIHNFSALCVCGLNICDALMRHSIWLNNYHGLIAALLDKLCVIM